MVPNSRCCVGRGCKMKDRKWDLGDLAVASVVVLLGVIAFKNLGGVQWTLHPVILPFLKAAGFLVVGAVGAAWLCANAQTKETAEGAGFFGVQLLALAALVVFVGILLTKASDALQTLQTILKV